MTESDDEYLPATQNEMSRWMSENAAQAARPIYPVGGRTALHYGYPIDKPGITLSTSKLTNVIDYPARDMTITVEAGIRIDDLVATLRTERQRLAVDVAQSHRATLGGAVATNASGPRRYGLGTLRDYVIGVSAIDAAGTPFKAGGRVVKNVAGYDLCKMLIGSLGTLAVVTQLTLKLRPEPESTGLLWVPFDRLSAIDDVLERLLTSASRPVALDVLDSRAAVTVMVEAGLELPRGRPVLCIGVEGTGRETEWQIETLKSEIAPFGPKEFVTVADAAAARLWTALTEFQVSSEEPVTFKVSLLPSKMMDFVTHCDGLGLTVQAHAGNGIAIGHLPDGVTTAAAAREILTPLGDLARRSGGDLVILNCAAGWKRELPMFGEPGPAWPLMRKLKSQLDPRNLLNPHRFIEPV